LLSWRVFLQRSQWSDQKRKYMSFILLNFTYSITKNILYNERRTINTSNTFDIQSTTNVQQSTTQLSKASFYILRVKQARTSFKRIVSPHQTVRTCPPYLHGTQDESQTFLSGINHLVSRTNY